MRSFPTRRSSDLIGGILQIAVIFLGFGLIGLALVQVFIMLSMGITIYVIMKKHVPWFGWGEVNLKRTVSFSKISGGFVGSDRKSTRLNSSHVATSYAVFCLKKNSDTPTVGIWFHDTWRCSLRASKSQ